MNAVHPPPTRKVLRPGIVLICSVNNDVEVKDNGVSRLVIPILCIYDIGSLSPMLVQSIVTPASARTKAE